MENDWIIETTDESFETDVIDASKQGLVLVDFWAAWCQPCRLLAPLLEQAIEKQAGQVKLVKANTDLNSQQAMRFGVQGIPAVYAVAYEDVVDGFTGVLPESQLEEWISKNVRSFKLKQAQQISESNPEEAKQLFQIIIDSDPKNAEAAIGLANLALNEGDIDQARAQIEQLEQRGFLEPAAEAIKTRLELESRDGSSLSELESLVKEEPSEHGHKIEYARALAAEKQYESALDNLLNVVRENKGDLREQAREQMVALFGVIDDEELVRNYRKKLSLELY